MIPEALSTQLKTCQKLVVLTGAGVSAESGIPTYRDALAGLWKDYNFMQLASADGFLDNPASVWGWYESRRKQLQSISPNAAHTVLAKLQQHVPEMLVITQNVDDLHERAGSSQVLHLHGSITQAFCFDCRAPYTHATLQAEEGAAIIEQEIEPPLCEHCGGKIRPGVVWFGETLNENDLGAAEVHAMEAEILLVIGTSGLVYPAANLPYLAQMAGAVLVQINPEPTWIESIVSYNIPGKAGEVMQALYQATFEGS